MKNKRSKFKVSQKKILPVSDFKPNKEAYIDGKFKSLIWDYC